MHPCIAQPAATAVLNGRSPVFQYPDFVWNHGEGFSTGANEDTGGWHSSDDGSGVQATDIHLVSAWSNWTWNTVLHPAGGQTIRRFVGALRDPQNPFPQVHPLYGQVPAGSGPFSNGTFVDQAAFEVFAPTSQPSPTQTIVVLISPWNTTGPPAALQGKVLGAVYDGIFSPDGLRRPENGGATGVPSMSTFLANTADNVERSWLAPAIVATSVWRGTTYWPIAAYAVQTLPGRQTSLNEQRAMQVRQAVLQMLQLPQPDPRNPLSQALSEQEVQQRVVVVFLGGSNGHTQTTFAMLRFPDRIHGGYGHVINPSHQRLFGEQDMGWAFGQLAGLAELGGATGEADFVNWGQYAWNNGYWIHDLCMTRRLARNQMYRPIVYRNGDEDITSTGTDWVALASGAGWSEAGLSPPSTPPNWPIGSQLAWSIVRNACHEANNVMQNPYGGGQTYYWDEIAHGLILQAIANRAAQVAISPPPTPAQVQPDNRTSQMRGLEEPHEWALGRVGAPMSNSNPAIMIEDNAWFGTVQPGAAGTWLGYREAMLIRDHRLYVVGAEGVVTAFEVDLTPGNRHRLVKVAHTHDANGRPMSLGLSATALAPAPGSGSNWELVVGTRRHLYKLDRQSLNILAGPVEIPWEVSQPHNMAVGDVLPSVFNAGPEIVFASVHGGLVFYTTNLQPLYEWPEPGIVDFVIRGQNTVTILSRRGVLADISFAGVTSPSGAPQLLAASRPIPRKYQEHVTSYVEALDSPSQGLPQPIFRRIGWRFVEGDELRDTQWPATVTSEVDGCRVA